MENDINPSKKVVSFSAKDINPPEMRVEDPEIEVITPKEEIGLLEVKLIH